MFTTKQTSDIRSSSSVDTLFVFTTSTAISEALFAVLALIRFFARVNAQVTLKIARLYELLFAVGASEGLLMEMNALVPGQIAIEAERSSAVGTLVRLDLCVRPHVNVQIGLQIKAFFAATALVPLFLIMHRTHVIVSVARLGEFFVAVRTLEHMTVAVTALVVRRKQLCRRERQRLRTFGAWKSAFDA